jgi:hypothetical protein
MKEVLLYQYLVDAVSAELESSRLSSHLHNSPAVRLVNTQLRYSLQTYFLTFLSLENACLAHALWAAEVSSSERAASQSHHNCSACLQAAQVGLAEHLDTSINMKVA